MSAPRPTHAPSVTLPLRYLLAGLTAFLVAALAAPWLARELAGHYYQPRLTALTHTVTLGWITLSIMGASYQFLPVVLERPIWSERLARWQYWILLVGVTGMVAHFALATWPGLLLAAALVALGIAAHLVNMALTLRGAPWRSVTTPLVTLACGGLALTTALGLALGVDRIWRFLPGEFFPTLHAHFHLALLGWVAPMLLAVSARVYPMFLLAPEPPGWPGALQLWGLAVGLPALIGGLLAAPALVLPGALATAVAAAGHLAWILAIVRGRRRPALDWGLRFALTGAGFLVPVTVLGLGFALDLLAGPRLALVYAVLALGGWISLSIAGVMLKIVPFLVWYRVYGPRVGRAPVPTLAELSSPRAEALAYALLTAGTGGLAMALAVGDPAWIGAATVAVALGSIALAVALLRVLRHLARGAARAPATAPAGAGAP